MANLPSIRIVHKHSNSIMRLLPFIDIVFGKEKEVVALTLVPFQFFFLKGLEIIVPGFPRLNHQKRPQ